MGFTLQATRRGAQEIRRARLETVPIYCFQCRDAIKLIFINVDFATWVIWIV